MSECREMEYQRYKLLLRALRRKEDAKDEKTDTEQTSDSQSQPEQVD